MPTINFKTSSGAQISVDAPSGYTLMEAGYNNDVPGIEAECGGAAACATCHVYIEADWVNLVGSIEDMEDSMLYMANDRQSNSRLSCQIYLTDELNGICVTVADNII